MAARCFPDGFFKPVLKDNIMLWIALVLVVDVM
jgi:hypothetical protein